jgi:hypothetical protein
MKERCTWIRNKIAGKCFIPGCMGGAVYGPGGCTCTSDITATDEMEIRIERLEKKVKQLEDIIRTK